MMLESLILLCVLIVLATMAVMRSNAKREEAWRDVVKQMVKDHKDTIDKAIRMVKSRDAEEAARAESVEKASELRLKLMQETMADDNALEEEDKPDEDRYKMYAADGREIDLRQWEIVG